MANAVSLAALKPNQMTWMKIHVATCTCAFGKMLLMACAISLRCVLTHSPLPRLSCIREQLRGRSAQRCSWQPCLATLLGNHPVSSWRHFLQKRKLPFSIMLIIGLSLLSPVKLAQVCGQIHQCLYAERRVMIAPRLKVNFIVRALTNSSARVKTQFNSCCQPELFMQWMNPLTFIDVSFDLFDVASLFVQMPRQNRFKRMMV